jgi:hypothetical protein
MRMLAGNFLNPSFGTMADVVHSERSCKIWFSRGKNGLSLSFQ